jgi:hypothetical protein
MQACSIQADLASLGDVIGSPKISLCHEHRRGQPADIIITYYRSKSKELISQTLRLAQKDYTLYFCMATGQPAKELNLRWLAVWLYKFLNLSFFILSTFFVLSSGEKPQRGCDLSRLDDSEDRNDAA